MLKLRMQRVNQSDQVASRLRDWNLEGVKGLGDHVNVRPGSIPTEGLEHGIIRARLPGIRGQTR